MGFKEIMSIVNLLVEQFLLFLQRKNMPPKNNADQFLESFVICSERLNATMRVYQKGKRVFVVLTECSPCLPGFKDAHFMAMNNWMLDTIAPKYVARGKAPVYLVQPGGTRSVRVSMKNSGGLRLRMTNVMP